VATSVAMPEVNAWVGSVADCAGFEKSSCRSQANDYSHGGWVSTLDFGRASTSQSVLPGPMLGRGHHGSPKQEGSKAVGCLGLGLRKDRCEETLPKGGATWW
jgi:hypothetical protein